MDLPIPVHARIIAVKSAQSGLRFAMSKLRSLKVRFDDIANTSQLFV